MAIIGINGYAGSGKDTIGRIIQYLNCPNKGNLSIEEVIKDYQDHEWWLEEQSGWEVRKFAGKLKDIAEHLTGIPLEKFEDQEFKKTDMGPEWGMTVRDFLQKLGTDTMRMGLHPNVWVNALMADYKKVEYNDDEQSEYPNWVITDVRFENEAKAIKEKNGIIIRVNRPDVNPINDHPSEIGLDHWNFDYKIANVSDVFDLKESVQQILKHAKLL
jgi:hypothetical protein